jgi:hypothetical protein
VKIGYASRVRLIMRRLAYSLYSMIERLARTNHGDISEERSERQGGLDQPIHARLEKKKEGEGKKK